MTSALLRQPNGLIFKTHVQPDGLIRLIDYNLVLGGIHSLSTPPFLVQKPTPTPQTTKATYDIRLGRMPRFRILGFHFHCRDATASRQAWTYKKSALSIHALAGSPTTGLLNRMGERARVGRVLLAID